MIEETEQWRLKGDCSKCRKSNYCKKQCAVSRDMTNQMIYGMITKRTGLNKITEFINEVFND